MSEEHLDVVEARGTVLVVDDFAHNRTMIREVLINDGHSVREACDGESALEICQADPPDCLLLDIMLPGLDGYDVCRALKSNPRTCHIPVLLITALSERDDRIRGIAVGASDFLSKPIDVTDVRLRVRNAIYTKSIIDESRSKALTENQRDDAISRIVSMALHCQRGPLTVLGGYLSLLRQRSERSDDEQLKEFIAKAVDEHRAASDSLQTAINAYLPITDPFWAFRLAPIDCGDMLRDYCASRDKLKLVAAADDVVIAVDQKVLLQALNGIVGAMRSQNRDGGDLQMTLTIEGGNAHVSIDDQGPPWHEKVGGDVFDRYNTDGGLDRLNVGTSLAFARRVIELHGGEIGLTGREGGNRIWFTLPLSPAMLQPPRN